MKWALINITENDVLEVTDNKFPVHESLSWVSFDENVYSIDMSNVGEWKYKNNKFIEPEPWILYPGITLSEAKIQKKKDIRNIIYGQYTTISDPFWLEYKRKEIRGMTLPTIPDSLIVYEDLLDSVWKQTKLDIDSLTTVKDIVAYNINLPIIPNL